MRHDFTLSLFFISFHFDLLFIYSTENYLVVSEWNQIGRRFSYWSIRTRALGNNFTDHQDLLYRQHVES